MPNVWFSSYYLRTSSYKPVLQTRGLVPRPHTKLQNQSLCEAALRRQELLYKSFISDLIASARRLHIPLAPGPPSVRKVLLLKQRITCWSQAAWSSLMHLTASSWFTPTSARFSVLRCVPLWETGTCLIRPGGTQIRRLCWKWCLFIGMFPSHRYLCI